MDITKERAQNHLKTRRRHLNLMVKISFAALSLSPTQTDNRSKNENKSKDARENWCCSTQKFWINKRKMPIKYGNASTFLLFHSFQAYAKRIAHMFASLTVHRSWVRCAVKTFGIHIDGNHSALAGLIFNIGSINFPFACTFEKFDELFKFNYFPFRLLSRRKDNKQTYQNRRVVALCLSTIKSQPIRWLSECVRSITMYTNNNNAYDYEWLFGVHDVYHTYTQNNCTMLR